MSRKAAKKPKENQAIPQQLAALGEIRRLHEWTVVRKEQEKKEESRRRSDLSYAGLEGALMLSDEITELLDAAIYREVVSRATYEAGQTKTDDLAARALMRDLAAEEARHAELLRGLKEKGIRLGRPPESPGDLKISEYLVDVKTPEGAGLQETLIFAMKREQQSVAFYTNMMSAVSGLRAKRLCARLAREEIGHKLRLELLYESLFYREV